MTLAGLLVLSLWNFGAVLSGAPAFDKSARRAGLFGDWRVPDGPALYNQADYLFQMAYAYLQADALSSGVTEGPDEIAAADTARSRASTASDLLEESVALAPGNAPAWTSLAWAYALQGRYAPAEQALAVSWGLAPYNADLAASRLVLADLLGARENGATQPPVVMKAGARKDIAVLERFRPEIIQEILSASPLLRAIAAQDAAAPRHS